MENMYPQHGATQQQERKGVSRMASEVADLGLIWRETPNSDVGIDGQIEFVDADGFATGLVIAVQVKSGSSYLNIKDGRIVYRPLAKHANYWREFPIPVPLAIHDPKSQKIFWADARQQLRAGQDDNILIPLSQTVFDADAAAFFATLRPIEKQLSESQVITALAANVHNDAGFQLSFLDLFGFGITDIGRKLFFSMSLCMEIVEPRAAQHDVGVGVGHAEHRFIEAYVTFLVSQALVYYDYSDYLIDRDERQMSPTFLVPLTRKGQKVLEGLQRISGDLFHEALLRLDLRSVASILQRLSAVEALGQKLRAGT
jgi:hypothetical protein